MNKAYIVVFSSRNKSAAIVDRIKQYSGWGRVGDNAYVVLTPKSAAEVRDDLLVLKEPSDRLFVVKSGVESAWSNTPASNEWLKKYL